MFLSRLLLVIGLLNCGLRVHAQEQRRPVAFTHITVIDCTGVPAQPDMTVVVTGDRISALGKTGKITLPEKVRVVEGSGKFLIPGLWDMHVHSRDYSSPLFVANGVTGVRIMWGTTGRLYLRDRVRQATRLDYRRVVASPVVHDDSRSRKSNSLSVSTPDEAKTAVRKAKESGYEFIKIGSYLKKELYVAVADEAEKLRIPFAGHVPYSIGAGFASDSGQQSIEHLTGVSVACSRFRDEILTQQAKADNFATILSIWRRYSDTFDPKTANALFAKFVKNKTWHCPTLIVWEWNARADDPGVFRDPRLEYLPASESGRWNNRRKRFLKHNSVDDYKKSFLERLRIVGEMYRAGVKFLAGSDTPNPYCLQGFGLHDELNLLVKAGLSPMAALQTATRNPAEYLGRLKDLGTIEQGKRADLVLLDKNPLVDIRNSRQISGVMLNGHWLDKNAIRKMIAHTKLTARIENLGGKWDRDNTKLDQPVFLVSFEKK